MTDLEIRRDALGLRQASAHVGDWRVQPAGERFVWLFDGDRGVALIDRETQSLELRCAGPACLCPSAVLPKHYHVVTQTGVRILFLWRLRGKGCGEPGPVSLDIEAARDGIRVHARQPWSDGSVAEVTLRLAHEPAWDRYVVDAQAVLRARRVATALEYCNVLPAGIGDSRPGREKYPWTFWRHPDGYRKMLKNPLWFCSAGAQDLAGEKRIAPGGCIGFGPEADLNPVIEVVASSPASGCMTCDNLQDEHVMVLPPDGTHAASGWYRLAAHYRLFSVPQPLAEHIVQGAALMKPGAFLAWKFQYPATPELPDDLRGVALPGAPFHGPADWSRGIPWDAPFNGRLWTASPDPAAAIHFDRQAGARTPGAIRLRVAGERLEFAPGSGHTLHTDAGATCRLSAWVRTEGQVRAGLKLLDLLYRPGDGRTFASATLPADSDWTRLETEFTARGDEAPFADTVLCAEGTGQAWFSDLVFEALPPRASAG
jgi:hypothetical protein